MTYYPKEYLKNPENWTAPVWLITKAVPTGNSAYGVWPGYTSVKVILPPAAGMINGPNVLSCPGKEIVVAPAIIKPIPTRKICDAVLAATMMLLPVVVKLTPTVMT